MRDIFLNHARAWSEAYLEAYLARQWHDPLRSLSEDVSKRLASKGKAHSPKQFAKLAAPLANMWFGGDLTAVSVVILHASPVTQRAARVVPKDILSCADALYTQWLDVAARHNLKTNFEDFADQRPALQAEGLTRLSLDYLQLTELLGEVPNHEQFAQQRKIYERDAITRLLQDVTQEPEAAWELFVAISTPSLAPGHVDSPAPVDVVMLSEAREEPPPLPLPVDDAQTEKPKGPFSWFNRMLGKNRQS